MSDQSKVGPQSNMTGVLIKRETRQGECRVNAQTQREHSHVDTEVEGGAKLVFSLPTGLETHKIHVPRFYREVSFSESVCGRDNHPNTGIFHPHVQPGHSQLEALFPVSSAQRLSRSATPTLLPPKMTS